MDLHKKPVGFTLSSTPQPPGRIGSRPYYLTLAGIAITICIVIGGIAFKSYSPAAKSKDEDSADQRKGAAMAAGSAANAIVNNMKSQNTENQPAAAGTGPNTQVPDLSKEHSVWPTQSQQQNSDPTGQQSQLSPSEQVRLASYNREVEAMTTPLGQAQQNSQSFEQPSASTTSMPPVGAGDIEDAIPQLQHALAPQIKSHATPDENAIIVNPPPGALMIRAGTWIYITMDMLGSSDVAGDLFARVTRDIFDTHDGKRHLMIPLGTRLIGSHDARVPYGQDRMIQVWNRIQFNDGRSITLGDMNGADTDGSTGVRDKVNNHYMKLIRDAALVTAFAAGVGLTQRNQSLLTTQSVSGSVSQSVGNQLAQLGSELTSRNLNIPPTVENRPGKEIDVPVRNSIIFDQDPFPNQ